MKKVICILLSLLLVLTLSVTAFAAEFEIDEHAAMDGMSRSWYQGYAPTISGHTMTLCLPLRAASCVGSISVSIALEDPNVFLLTADPKEVTVSPRDGVYPVKLTLSLERDRRNGDYPATVTVKGTNGSGKEVTQSFPYVIRIRDGYGSHETLEPVLSDIVGDLNVGSEGSLTMTLTNPTTTLSITECVLTVTDATGEILMSGANRMEVPEILPGQSQSITIPMTVKADAAISPHTLEVNLDYKALDQEAQWTQSFTVPVTQAIRLEHGGVQMPEAIAGDLANMTLPLMNMGKGELQNVLVKLEMEGVLEPQSVLVGTMTAGETKQAKLTFTPKLDSVGVHSGTVTVSCEDAYGNPFSQTLEVTLRVDAPVPEEEAQEEEKEKPGIGSITLIILCALLAAGLAIQGKVLTDKLHKLEEERL